MESRGRTAATEIVRSVLQRRRDGPVRLNPLLRSLGIVANLMPATDHRPVPLANGLVYVDAQMPGLRRFKRGKTFRYKDAKGSWIRDADELARIRRLAIPPAYRDVWICPLQNGHLQATGIDVRGRKQYRYHTEWRALKDQTKFDRLQAFGRALPAIRRRVTRDLQRGTKEPLHQNLVLATLVHLLDTTFLRVGNEEYANNNGSYGLTTLLNKHASIRGSSLKLRFRISRLARPDHGGAGRPGREGGQDVYNE